MRYARIYPWRRTRRFRAPSNGPEAFFVAQFSAGRTPNIFGFDLRQGQPICPDLIYDRHSYQGQSGKNFLGLSFSGFDPKRCSATAKHLALSPTTMGVG